MNAHGGKLCGKCSVPLVNVETDGTLRPWLSGDNVGTVWTWNNNSFRTKTIIPRTIGEPIAEGVEVAISGQKMNPWGCPASVHLVWAWNGSEAMCSSGTSARTSMAPHARTGPTRKSNGFLVPASGRCANEWASLQSGRYD